MSVEESKKPTKKAAKSDPTPKLTGEKRWYVIRVISGKEKKTQQYLENEISRSNLREAIPQVLLPTEKVYSVKNGKKVIKERNFFPGYLLMEAVDSKLNSDVVQQLRAVTGVIGFLSEEKGTNIPVPMRQAEINKILGKVDALHETGEVNVEPFIIGETVKIIDGPFNDFNGTIEEINDEKKKLKVIVKIFGRRTPLELNFIQVEKQV